MHITIELNVEDDINPKAIADAMASLARTVGATRSKLYIDGELNAEVFSEDMEEGD